MHDRWLAAVLAGPLLLTACERTESASAETEGGRASAVEATGEPKVTASGSVTDGAAIDDLATLVEAMRADFRNCYASALATDPKMAGSVRVTLDVGPSGAIGGASTAASKGVSKALATCIDTRVRKTRFKAPKGPRSTVMITVELAP